MRYLSAIVILILIWLYRLGSGSPVDSANVAQSLEGSHRTWGVSLARRLGNDNPSKGVLDFIEAWTRAEGTKAAHNPLATTYLMPGSTPFNDANVVGVQNYLSEDDGIEATVRTLAGGYEGYNDIVMGIRHNDADLALSGLFKSPWGTNPNLVKQIVNEIRDRTESRGSRKKCPYTNTMNYASNFYSTDGPWGRIGQFKGLHLGVDFTGNEGEEVLAPFDMLVDVTDSYHDPDRLGKFVQARFTHDNVLFYSGHLIDVFVSPGQLVEACTKIGTMGATSFKHTHIKLAGPNAPIPCEGSQPGWDTGCIDPIEYWNNN